MQSRSAASFVQVESKLVPLAARWSPILVSGGSASTDACGCDAGVAFQSLAVGIPPAYLALTETLSGTCAAAAATPSVYVAGRAFDIVVDATTKAMLASQKAAGKGSTKPTCPVCNAHKSEVAAAAKHLADEQRTREDSVSSAVVRCTDCYVDGRGDARKVRLRANLFFCCR